MKSHIIVLGLCAALIFTGCVSEQPVESEVKNINQEPTTEEAVSESTQGVVDIESDDTADESAVSSEDSAVDDHDHSFCKGVGYEYDEDSLNYQLVWSDEFDYVGLPNDDLWNYDVGGSGWGNNELQFYTAGDNAFVEGGQLTITARKETYNAKEYTSTRLISKNKGDWLYGRIEISAKLPSGRGTWPAIWMLPTDWSYGGWPRSGEIDIMEHVGFDMGQIHGTIHTEAYNHGKGTQLGKTVTRDDAFEVFHKYSIEWFPDKIKFFVDDKIYYVYKPSNMIDHPGIAEWPFDKRFHLLLNIAVGGDWGGAKGVDQDVFPQEMVVDYVRVYQAEAFEKYQ